MLNFAQCQFLLSAPNLRHAPPDNAQEVAFAGRSNVGKSSVINALCQQRKLARSSRTPGRTQSLNFFSLAEQRYLVDLPGYGYAKVPDKEKQAWSQMLNSYFTQRQSLVGLVLIMDIRHPLTELDQHILTWAREQDFALHLLLNKADKLGHGARQQTVFKVKQTLSDWDIDYSLQCFSSLKKIGIGELREFIMRCLNKRS